VYREGFSRNNVLLTWQLNLRTSGQEASGSKPKCALSQPLQSVGSHSGNGRELQLGGARFESRSRLRLSWPFVFVLSSHPTGTLPRSRHDRFFRFVAMTFRITTAVLGIIHRPVSENGFCVHRQVEPIQLGSIDRTSFLSLDWSRFHLKTERDPVSETSCF
jgi:hypothetical protein